VERIEVAQGDRPGGVWVLRGVTSNVRYATREEKDELAARQAPLGRPEAARAALIPIRKSADWWGLTQDERRKIFEETSHHTAIGLKYLPAIARRLHHCRDLASAEPFDFLTWFDFAAKHAQAFEDLVGALRASEEWQYVDRELDIRLALDGV
jgi:chlorite dismutase